MANEIILPHGNYQKLVPYKTSVVIFDCTYIFCSRFLRRGDRTIDQMVQAARSGKQNIIEGSKASKISKETEIKLIGVARASLEELLEDYKDYVRTRELKFYAKDDLRCLYFRKFKVENVQFADIFKNNAKKENAELVCNMMITLIYQTNFLLDRLLKTLERDFTKHGSVRERMYQARTNYKATAIYLDKSEQEKLMQELRELYKEVAQFEIGETQKAECLQKITKIAQRFKKKG